MKAQKFNIGDKVQIKADPVGEVHEVIGFSYDREKGFSYTITSKEVDVIKKEVINGISFHREGELQAWKKH